MVFGPTCVHFVCSFTEYMSSCTSMVTLYTKARTDQKKSFSVIEFVKRWIAIN